PWRTSRSGTAINRVSEILPGGRSRRALGRRSGRHDRRFRLQLDDTEILVSVAAFRKAEHASERHRPGASVEDIAASGAQPRDEPNADHLRLQHRLDRALPE